MNKISTHPSQSGSIHALIALVLVVAIIGTVGYMFWNRVSADDTLLYNPEVEVTSDTDVDELRGAPPSFRSFINGRITLANESLGENTGDCFNTISVRKIAGNEYALGDITLDGPNDECVGYSSEIWALDSDDSWQIVDTSQDNRYGCDKLVEYEVPAIIAGDECYSEDKRLIPYTL